MDFTIFQCCHPFFTKNATSNNELARCTPWMTFLFTFFIYWQKIRIIMCIKGQFFSLNIFYLQLWVLCKTSNCKNMKNLILNVSISEESLLVPDFTISVYGSSCNSLFFGAILASFLSLYTYWHSQGWMECRGIDRGRKEGIMRPKKR